MDRTDATATVPSRSDCGRPRRADAYAARRRSAPDRWRMREATLGPDSPQNPQRPLRRSGRRLLLTLLAAAAGTSHSTLCQDASPDLTSVGSEAVLNMEGTSVSKTPERFIDAAAAVQGITSDDIRRQRARTLPHLLRPVPGAQGAPV